MVDRPSRQAPPGQVGFGVLLRSLRERALIGILGYVLIKCGCEPAPLLLGFVLGPLLEENLHRRS